MNVLVLSASDVQNVQASDAQSGNNQIIPALLDDGSQILNADILTESGAGKIFVKFASTLTKATQTVKATPILAADVAEAALLPPPKLGGAAVVTAKVASPASAPAPKKLG